MSDFLEYIFSEVHAGRMEKSHAMTLILEQNVSVNSDISHSNDFDLHLLTKSDIEADSSLLVGCLLTGQEPFLTDHVVGGKKTLPAVAYLKLAYQGVFNFLEGFIADQNLAVENITFSTPCHVDSEKEVFVLYDISVRECIRFYVYSELSGSTILHAQGSVVFEPNAVNEERLDLNSYSLNKISTSLKTYHNNDVYEKYRGLGLVYGSSHRLIDNVKVFYDSEYLDEVVFSEIIIGNENVSSSDIKDNPFCSIGVLDSAVQSLIGFGMESSLTPSVPFSIDKFAFYSSLSGRAYVRVRPQAYAAGEVDRESRVKASNEDKFDIDVFSESGDLSAKFSGFYARNITSGDDGCMDKNPLNIFEATWIDPGKEKNYPENTKQDISRSGCEKILILIGRKEHKKLFSKDGLEGVKVLNYDVESSCFEDVAVEIFSFLKKISVSGLKEINVRVWVLCESGDETYSGISGMIKSAMQESAKINGSCIRYPVEDSRKLSLSHIKHEFLCSDTDVKYIDGERHVLGLVPLCNNKNDNSEIYGVVDHGVYVITGGLGGLGKAFAAYLVSNFIGVKIYLVGRSDLNAIDKNVIGGLEKNAKPESRVFYASIDCSDEKSVSGFINTILTDQGRLNGVIHAAGLLQDSMLLQKSEASYRKVLAPKVRGIVNLDEATKDLELDFFIGFSSVSATFGNVGQSDYACANSFVDEYLQLRGLRVQAGSRAGHSLSINWPLWDSSGMSVDVSTLDYLKSTAGMEPLPLPIGIKAFFDLINLGDHRAVVLYGDDIKLDMFGVRAGPKVFIQERSDSKQSNIGDLTNGGGLKDDRFTGHTVTDTEFDVRGNLLKVLISSAAEHLNIDPSMIDEESELSEFGFDSVTLTGFSNALNSLYDFQLTPTTFFEYPTLEKICFYLMDHHQVEVDRYFGENCHDSAITHVENVNDLAGELKNLVPGKAVVPNFDVVLASKQLRGMLGSVNNSRVVGNQQLQNDIRDDAEGDELVEVNTQHSNKNGLYRKDGIASNKTEAYRNSSFANKASTTTPVAIVGVSGCFPGAPEIQEFWENLESGRDCITEIPDSRWDWSSIFGNPGKDKNKTNIKSAGVIEGIDLFDPLFFGISPVEAAAMDPQQRLLMTYVWKAIEDSGHAPESLSGSNTGIFVGTGSSGYGAFASASGVPIEGYSVAAMSTSVGPNRMSYLLDIHGPSEPIETACSSSLVAVHRAVRALRSGECEQAIVGGVNTLISPESHISFSKAGMLSKDGRCKTFSKDANGYVRGEGVGMLVLKLLPQAEADGDHIYALIRGTAENHGGRSNSLTAPNPRAQADLIKSAIRDSNIEIRTVTYVEAHGTGTSLGDPVEIQGLKSAFSELAEEQELKLPEKYCGLGSVKTNIGHLELAAGVAGIIKVLLQMKRKTIVPSLHCDEINPYIDLDDSPFRIVTEKQSWDTIEDELGAPLPRRAGVSSFGFGGVNSHVVLEEYISPNSEKIHSTVFPKSAIIILSARTEERLRAQVHQLSAYLNLYSDKINLHDLAFTLQDGRDAMEHRWACYVDSIEQLRKLLSAWLGGERLIGKVFIGDVKKNKNLTRLFSNDEDLRGAISTWMAKRKLDKICEIWVSGLSWEWKKLYSTLPKRVSLPGYPFSMERYWYTQDVDSSIKPLSDIGAAKVEVGMTDGASETLKKVIRLYGNEEFLIDHVVNDAKTLPGVMYVEFLRRVANEVLGIQSELTLERVAFVQPLIVWESPADVHISFERVDTVNHTDQSWSFKVYTLSSGNDNVQEILHAMGALRKSYENISFPHFKKQDFSVENAINVDSVYKEFEKNGLRYGPSHRSLKHLMLDQIGSEVRVISELSVSAFDKSFSKDTNIHPGILDGALQSLIAFRSVDSADSDRVFIPFSIEKVGLLSPLGTNATAVACLTSEKESKTSIFDIDVYNESGELSVFLKGFCCRAIGNDVDFDDGNALSVEGSEMEQHEEVEFFDHIKTFVKKEISNQLSLDISLIYDEAELGEFGFDSVTLTGFATRLNEKYGFTLMPTTFYEHPTVLEFSSYLKEEYSDILCEKIVPRHHAIHNEGKTSEHTTSQKPSETVERSSAPIHELPESNPDVTVNEAHDNPVVIVGMSGCFPKASNLDEFWENLQTGEDCISEIPGSRWDWDALYGDPENEVNKTNRKQAGIIPELDQFDPLFFGISPSEAEVMDPQQRLLMTYAWKAVEDAGHAPGSLSGTDTGIFVGTGSSGYSTLLGLAGTPIEGHSASGMVGSVGPNRMSYFLNIHGPSEPIETACSSSLVAIHRAVNAIESGHCQQAIVGGINTLVNPEVHISFDKAGMLSKDGRCKPFSNKANGYVRGEGVGMLFLKRLKDAKKDGNKIYAVIRGSAENHGGRSNSLTAPNPKAQSAVIRRAIQNSGVDPYSITYIETHGTGTPLGDPIEIQGLKSAYHFGEGSVSGHQCGLGSVKSNIGHLELAAGVAGVIKVILQLQHKKLVKSLHCPELNEYIKLDESPFFIVNENKDWKAVTDHNGLAIPRRAGVSSFGFGGVNAHVILEEYNNFDVDPVQVFSEKEGTYLIPLSAKSFDQVRKYASLLLDYIQSDCNAICIQSLAYTLQVGRDHMECRWISIVSSVNDLIAALESYIRDDVSSNFITGDARKYRDLKLAFSTDDELQSSLRHWFDKKKFIKVSEFWAKGVDMPWAHQYQNQYVQRLHLPTYPFLCERYWPPVLARQAFSKKDIGTIAPVGTNNLECEPNAQEGNLDRAMPLVADKNWESLTTEGTNQFTTLKLVVEDKLKHYISSATQIPLSEIESDEPFESYGLDSIIISKLNNMLGKVFSGLTKTLFYEHDDIASLATMLVHNERPACEAWCHDGHSTQPVIESDHQLNSQEENRLISAQRDVWQQCAQEEEEIMREPIAIIGLDGRYARSENIHDYWKNIADGVDCISEIPKDRWSIDKYYDADRTEEGLKKGKSYSKWGGFLDGFNEFDPMFFNIIPKEAKDMDPQERIFLQMCWSAMEDAGYTRNRLAEQHGSRVGVFVGITKTGFALYGPELWREGQEGFPSTSFSSIANRVSYIFNLTGPSMPIDTMCSASLTAIHEACEHIYRDECEIAIAGGVNLYLHPASYIQLCGQQMLSPTGKCKSFGEGADGFVPGEGVGAVLLKRLSQAELDGDHIYGVIRGTSVNHGGKTNGYTVPNPNAHSELIKKALEKSNVHPRMISYVEAHGTGTDLGDPIEVTGLTNAFNTKTSDKGFCALGSAKSNIGHCESAAGIAGLTKVLMQMRHGKIAPSLHSEKLNPNIDFEATPFYVPQRLSDWVRPSVDLDGKGEKEFPRIAGLSSFGAGGSNAHVIVEEYIVTPKHIVAKENTPIPILISARSDERLLVYAKLLLEFTKNHDFSFEDLAYTLQVGREAFACRFACLVKNELELQEALSNFVSSQPGNYIVDNTKKRKKSVIQFKKDVNIKEWLESTLRSRRVDELIEKWVQGIDVDWRQMWKGTTVSTISLPSYPFEKQKFWISLHEEAGRSDFSMGNDLISEVDATTVMSKSSSLDGVLSISNESGVSLVERICLIFGEITGLSLEKVDIDEPLESYGIDSILITKLNQALSKVFSNLPKTLFYEYFTLSQVAAYLEKERSQEVILWLSNGKIDSGEALVEEKYQEDIQREKDIDGITLEKDGVPLSLLLLEPTWNPSNISKFFESNYSDHFVFLCGFSDDISSEVSHSLSGGAKVVRLAECIGSVADSYTEYASQLLQYIKQLLAIKNGGEVKLQLVVSNKHDSITNFALTGMLKCLHHESPKVHVQSICVDSSLSAHSICDVIADEKRTISPDVKYENGVRYLPSLSKASGDSKSQAFEWKKGGVYIITGGLGGLGLMFAEYIATQAPGVKLILTGRSNFSATHNESLKIIRDLGAFVEYVQLDVSDALAVKATVNSVLGGYGNITGVIHSAGVLNDGFIFNKKESELKRVFSPKVHGVIALDEATKDIDLDVFINFSSTAAAFGNVGQSDYAAANAFLDAYATYRAQLADQGLRTGRSLSINWPLWESGGMQISKEHQKIQWDSLGLVPLETQHGLVALSKALNQVESQAVVLFGDEIKIRKVMLGESAEDINASLSCDKHVSESYQVIDSNLALDINKNETENKKISNVSGDAKDTSVTDDESIALWVEDQLKNELSRITSIPSDQIECDEPLESYGIDSVIISKLNQYLTKWYSNVTKTLFYEYQTLEDVAVYLSENHSENSLDWHGCIVGGEKKAQVNRSYDLTSSSSNGKDSVVSDLKNNHDKPLGINNNQCSSVSAGYEPIAIVGLSGRYPKSPDLLSFWENIKAGADCIEEIPEDRWQLEDYYTEDPRTAVSLGRSYCKWAGMLEDIACFDADFFGIPMAEAANIDPQERLFLESSWHVLEDAGYSLDRIKVEHNNEVGVFAGVTKTGFDLYCPDLWKIGEEGTQRTSFSSIANRVSYLFDFRGPSMPVDTMCSSSLTAIHQACQSLQQRDCQLAIAGGVNLYIHKSNITDLCGDMMLSPDGKCKSFGDGANGFVPAEGVGTVLLKRLDEAERDGDHIYGIVRGSHTNHGGKTNGYRVPNPNAQRELIKRALEKAGVHPRSISYVEAHGTGTHLGDPIEATALNQAFREKTNDTGFCFLGSVKSNIGHAESAAGIAGLTKILLQMKHGLIAPSLHSQRTNKNINFDQTAFKVPQVLSEWTRPKVSEASNQDACEVPRRACISSFGAGGANAHLVIEEYVSDEIDKNNNDREDNIFVVSAKSKEALIRRLKQLQTYIEGNNISPTALSYALQLGREPMKYRFACVANTVQELQKNITYLLKGDFDNKDAAFFSTLSPSGDGANELIGRDLALSVDCSPSLLAQSWVNGDKEDWYSFWKDLGAKSTYVGLPIYIFDKPLCWPQGMIHLVNGSVGSKEKISTVTDEVNVDIKTLLSVEKLNAYLPSDKALDDMEILALRRISDRLIAHVSPEIDRENSTEEDLSIVNSTPDPTKGDSAKGGQNLELNSLNREDLAKYARVILKEHVSLEASEASMNDYLTSVGLESINAIAVKRRLFQDIGVDIDPTDLLNNMTLDGFIIFLRDEIKKKESEGEVGEAVEATSQNQVNVGETWTLRESKDNYVEYEL